VGTEELLKTPYGRASKEFLRAAICGLEREGEWSIRKCKSVKWGDSPCLPNTEEH